MKKSNKFSPEARERAVRMVEEHRGEYPSLWAAIESIAPKIGCVPQTLNEWVKRVEVDTGARDGVTTAEAHRVKELERENKELRRANEILKLASAFLPRRSSTANSSTERLHRPAPWHLRGRAHLKSSADCPVGLRPEHGLTFLRSLWPRARTRNFYAWAVIATALLTYQYHQDVAISLWSAAAGDYGLRKATRANR
jgi:transposase